MYDKPEQNMQDRLEKSTAMEKIVLHNLKNVFDTTGTELRK